MQTSTLVAMARIALSTNSPAEKIMMCKEALKNPEIRKDRPDWFLDKMLQFRHMGNQQLESGFD